MIHKRGGQDTPFKERGKRPIAKSRQEALRAMALGGIGHKPDGKPVKGAVGPTPSDLGVLGQEVMGRSIHFGYKLQRGQRRS